jgi:hypothetical protein
MPIAVNSGSSPFVRFCGQQSPDSSPPAAIGPLGPARPRIGRSAMSS